jgi:hypothetical protein
MDSEREKAAAELHKAYRESDFQGPQSGVAQAADLRIANAAEYAAFQLGQINHSLKQIVRLLESKT